MDQERVVEPEFHAVVDVSEPRTHLMFMVEG